MFEKDFKKLEQLLRKTSKYNFKSFSMYLSDYSKEDITLLVIEYLIHKHIDLDNKYINNCIKYLFNYNNYGNDIRILNGIEVLMEKLNNLKFSSFDQQDYIASFIIKLTNYKLSLEKLRNIDGSTYECAHYLIFNVRNVNYVEELIKTNPNIINLAKNDKTIIIRVFNELSNLILNSIDNPLLLYYIKIIDLMFKYSFEHLDISKSIINNILNNIKEKSLNFPKEKKEKINIIIGNIRNKMKNPDSNIDTIKKLQIIYNINTNYGLYDPYDDKNYYEDMTNEFALTIDDYTTGLHDDAITIKKLSNGNTLLIVYTADTAASILEDGAWDRELRQKGETIYTSNGHHHLFDYGTAYKYFSLLCNRDRKVIAYIYEFTPKKELVSFDIKRAIIRVKYNLSPNIIDEAFNKNKRGVRGNLNSNDLLNNLLMFKEFFMNSNLQITSNYQQLKNIFKQKEEESSISHSIVENTMRLVKQTVAVRAFDLSIPFCYTNNTTKMEKNILGMLDEYKKDPTNVALIESLNKIYNPSFYSIENLGYSNGAMKANCEITNPIRKYMSIVNSRLAKKFIIDKTSIKSKDEINLLKKLRKICEEENRRVLLNLEYTKEASKILKKERNNRS